MLIYAKGAGVTHDHAEALKWFQKAADQGYPQAWSFVKMTEDAARKK